MSIRQNPVTGPLPDWRNFGVLLRIVLGVNLLMALAALVQPGRVSEWADRFVGLAAWVEMPLLATLCLLAALRERLWRLPARQGCAAVMVAAGVLAAVQHALGAWIGLTDGDPGGRWLAFVAGAIAAGLMLAYLDLLARAHAPAVSEARLMALNARIRPHFLFNSINAVLSLIRGDPKRAEAALETVSDLFRAALRDPSDWLPLSEEIALCRQYLELEKLRLGDRLQVEWDIHDVPLDEPIPPLMLQPLVENAVYHGIESSAEGGVIHIRFERRDDELFICISNPVIAGHRPSAGNQMALPNIRERLALYYDLEARLEIDEIGNTYRVQIHLPCKAKKNRSPS